MNKRQLNLRRRLEVSQNYFVVVLILVVTLLSTDLSLLAQTGCFTPQGPDCVGYDPQLNLPNNNEYRLSVYFHEITRGDGTGGVGQAAAETTLASLNSHFNEHGIYFEWSDCTLIPLPNDDFFENTFNERCNIYTANTQQNGFNIYLGPIESGFGGGFSSGIPGTAMVLMGQLNTQSPDGCDPFTQVSVYDTRTAVHEMGHMLGLYHTFHGTNSLDNSNIVCGTLYSDPGACSECVSGINGEICGDYVLDTRANPDASGNEFSPTSCIWTGNSVDSCEGRRFDPPTDNIMSYGPEECGTVFTPGQGRRMRNVLQYYRTGNGPGGFLPTNKCILDIRVGCTVPNGPCPGATFNIIYNICQIASSQTTSLDLQIAPTSIPLIFGGDFSSTGFLDNLNLPPGCTEATLSVTIPPSVPFGTNFEIELEITPLEPLKTCLNIGDNDCSVVNQFSVGTPEADFEFQQLGCEVQFQSAQKYGVHNWDFGDGNSSSLINPVHTYAEGGIYDVVHSVTYDDCNTVSVTNSVNVDGCGFGCPCAESGSNLGIPGETTFATDYDFTCLPDGLTASGCISIAGNFVINVPSLAFVRADIHMEPNSSIEVPSTSLLFISDSYLHGCERMWNGINVTGRLTISSGTLIEDAFEAVHANAGSTISVNNAVFNRNNIGVFSDGPFALIQRGTTFDCTAPLFPPMDGQFSAAGVSVANGNTITIGVQGSPPNTFRNLNNGIIANNNSLTVVNTNFENISAKGGGILPIAGFGIHAEAKNVGYRELIQTGNGLSTPSFQDCTYGISTVGMGAIIKRNWMRHMFDGILVRNGKQNVTIERNYVYRCRTGIGLILSDPNASRYVERNKIYVFGEGTGIVVQEPTVPNKMSSPGLVSTNAVFLMDSGEDMVGIGLITAARLEVRGNNIESIGEVGEKFGIHMSGGLANSVISNQVKGASATNDDIGISGWGAPQMLWSGNMVEKMTEGFQFNLTCSSKDGFRCNSMENHGIGLHINAGASLGTQNGTGNRWTPNTFSDIGVRAEDGGGAISTTLFTANPTIAEFWPTAFPTNMFVPNQTTIQCASSPEEDFGGEDGTDKQISENTSSTFNTVRYLSERYLYRKLSEQPNLLSADPSYASFFNSKGSTPVGRLHNMEEAIGNLMQIDNNTAQSMEVTHLQYLSTSESLLETDSLLVLATGQDSINLMATRTQLLEQLNQLEQSMTITWANVQAQRVSTTANLKTANNGIATSYVFETNDKAVNSLYLDWIENGQATLTSTQVITLTNIANQCPSTGGNAVFRARAMLSLVDLQYYGNDLNCIGQFAPTPKPEVAATKHLNKVLVYPNPASDVVNFSWEVMEGNGTLVFSDLMGKQVFSKTLDMTVGSAQVDTKALPPAMYICKLVQGNEMVLSSKIVINK